MRAATRRTRRSSASTRSPTRSRTSAVSPIRARSTSRSPRRRRQPDPRVDAVTPNRGPKQGGHDRSRSTERTSCRGKHRDHRVRRLAVLLRRTATFVSTTRRDVHRPVGDARPAPCATSPWSCSCSSGSAACSRTATRSTAACCRPLLPGGGTIFEGDTGTSHDERRCRVVGAVDATGDGRSGGRWSSAATRIADGADDYAPASGEVTFQPGETTKTVPVTVNGDLARRARRVRVRLLAHSDQRGDRRLLRARLRDRSATTTRRRRVQPGLGADRRKGTGTTQVLNVPVSLSTASGTHGDGGLDDARRSSQRDSVVRVDPGGLRGRRAAS